MRRIKGNKALLIGIGLLALGLFGDATMEVGARSETIIHDGLAPASFDTATFGLGSVSNEANVGVIFEPIGELAPAQITPTLVQLFPNGAEKIAVEGAFAIDESSNGIDPETEKVALRLHFPSGSRIYPVGGDDFMPAAFETTASGWRITAAEKQRTGIQDFEINKTLDPRRFDFKIVDVRTGLQSADYRSVRLSIDIGDDRGSIDMPLVQNNGQWTLG